MSSSLAAALTTSYIMGKRLKCIQHVCRDYNDKVLHYLQTKDLGMTEALTDDLLVGLSMASDLKMLDRKLRFSVVSPASANQQLKATQHKLCELTVKLVTDLAREEYKE